MNFYEIFKQTHVTVFRRIVVFHVSVRRKIVSLLSANFSFLFKPLNDAAVTCECPWFVSALARANSWLHCTHRFVIFSKAFFLPCFIFFSTLEKITLCRFLLQILTGLLFMMEQKTRQKIAPKNQRMLNLPWNPRGNSHRFPTVTPIFDCSKFRWKCSFTICSVAAFAFSHLGQIIYLFIYLLIFYYLPRSIFLFEKLRPFFY